MATRRDFITQFIAKFKQLPCLWQVTHQDYRNKHKKDLALEELLELYITKDPGASIDSVRRKIQSLRSCFRKENNKVKASIRSGARDVHVPKLWYYDQLLFLTEEEDTTTPASTIESVLIDPFDDMGEIDSNDFDSTAITVMSPSSQSSGSQRSTSRTSNATGRKRSKIQADDVLSRILERLDDRKPPPIQRQRYEAFGEHVAEKLRNLPDNMAIHCQKLINDAIYMAELGKLDMSSHIVTTNSDQNVNLKFPKASHLAS